MKTFFTIILLSALPTASLMVFNELRSMHNMAEVERVRNLPVSISVPSSEIEIDFVPTHSLYQKRCLVEGELVYCADTDALATVSVVDSEIEIDFIADAE